MTTPSEHRESVLTKITAYLEGVIENIAMQPESKERVAFDALIRNITAIATTMKDAKTDTEFVGAVKYLDGILAVEYFNKVYGTGNTKASEPTVEKSMGQKQKEFNLEEIMSGVKVDYSMSNDIDTAKNIEKTSEIIEFIGKMAEDAKSKGKKTGMMIVGDTSSMPPELQLKLKELMDKLGIDSDGKFN